jgi:hypothetical protein
MKRMLGLLGAVLLCLPSIALAVDFAGNSFTILRFEQRAFPGFDKKTVVPATEFVRLDADNLGYENLSLHLYGWGRADLADRSTADGTAEGNLTYGYMEYRFPKANGRIKAGRFFIFEGVASEQVDGVFARADLPAGFTLSVFGGAPVLLDRDTKSKGDYIVGGRLAYRLAGILELGVSGLHEGAVKLESGTGPRDDRQLVGGDIWLRPLKMVELNGHTYYSASTGGVAEHSYLLTVTPVKDFSVSAGYNDIRFKDYFAFSNLRTLFNPDAGDTLKSYGAGVTWTAAKPLEIIADYKRYERDNLGDSDRYGVEARLRLADGKSRSGLSYHRLDAANTLNSYHEARGYSLYDAVQYFASLDAIGHFYDDKIFNKKTAFEVIASLGYRFLPTLALSGDLSYGENPRLTEELRGVLRLSYDFTVSYKGAKK